MADYPYLDAPLDVVDTAPASSERAERVLAEAWHEFQMSPHAGSPFAWQAAALRAAGLLGD